ncbi:hypothetical protein ACGF3G_00445 [Streptomyces sp. NPDC048179]|uniref:hypothetical protein n=1 Tax=Streptomyces sp. NPDC048179 TaxID=3365506 RepID=UPI00371B62BC
MRVGPLPTTPPRIATGGTRMSLIDEFEHVVTDLEDEGHNLAGRFRDLVDEVKDKFGHLIGGGRDELDAFVKSLVATLVPELDKVKDEVVTAVIAELGKVVGEIKAAVDAADPTPAPEQVEPSTAPAQG